MISINEFAKDMGIELNAVQSQVLSCFYDGGYKHLVAALGRQTGKSLMCAVITLYEAYKAVQKMEHEVSDFYDMVFVVLSCTQENSILFQNNILDLIKKSSLMSNYEVSNKMIYFGSMHKVSVICTTYADYDFYLMGDYTAVICEDIAQSKNPVSVFDDLMKHTDRMISVSTPDKNGYMYEIYNSPLSNSSNVLKMNIGANNVDHLKPMMSQEQFEIEFEAKLIKRRSTIEVELPTVYADKIEEEARKRDLSPSDIITEIISKYYV